MPASGTQQMDDHEDALEELFRREFESLRPPPNHSAKYRYFRPKLNPTQELVYDEVAKYSLIFGERGSGKCSEPDACIYTATGLARIENLRPHTSAIDNWQAATGEVISFDGKALTTAKMDAFYTEPNREAKRVKFSNGNTLDCSPRHPLWGVWNESGQIRFGYRQSSDLQEFIAKGGKFWVPTFAHPNYVTQNYVTVQHLANGINEEKHWAIQSNLHLSISQGAKASGVTYHTFRDQKDRKAWETVLCEDVAYLLGVLTGDGGMNQGCTILTTANQEILNGITPGLRKLDCKIKKIPNDDWSYVIKGQKIHSLTRKLGLRCLSKHKRIPDLIIQSPKTVLVAFLKGLYDTDGYIEKTGSVNYCSASERLSWDVQNALQALGLFSCRTFKPNECAGAWIVALYGEDAREFRRVIGFNILLKAARLNSLRPPKHPVRSKNGFPELILSEMKRVMMSAPWYGHRKGQWKKFTAKYSVRKRSGGTWTVNGVLDGEYFHKTFHDGDSAKQYVDQQTAKRDLLQSHNREWHDKNRSVLQCKYVPHPAKLKRFIQLCGTSETLDQLQISSRWISVESVMDTTATLVDISVPETRSFIANGLINHNTVSALHKLVQHCRDTRNALAVLIVDVRRMAEEGGAWHKLEKVVLPEWQKGCRLEFTPSRMNPSTKDTYLWIGNRFGGWSKVLLLSMPHDSFVRDRVKGIEPSFIFVDEAQTLDSDNYFKYVVQQLRRPEAPLLQIIYCCNPAGPSHWLYQRFFIMPVQLNEETGESAWNKEYAIHHVPVSENIHNLPPGYYETLLEACRGDDTEYRRMILGEWIDVPDGDALFAEDFSYEKHVRGNLNEKLGLVPIKGYPIILGYDLGAAHSSIHFQQFIPTTEKLYWRVFDELNYVDRYTPYPILVPQLLKRMDYWNMLIGTAFPCEHISDNSAFNQWRATTGSFDAQDVERLSNGRIKMIECPKGPGSVETRVRQTREKLQDESLLISATCPKTPEMFQRMERDKDNFMMPRKKSRFRHSWDSLTYPHLFYGSTRQNKPVTTVAKVEPAAVYTMGAG